MFGCSVILPFASLLKEGSIWISTHHLANIHHGESTPNLCCLHADAQQELLKNFLPWEKSDLIGGVYHSRINRTTAEIESSIPAVGTCLKALRTH